VEQQFNKMHKGLRLNTDSGVFFALFLVLFPRFVYRIQHLIA